MRKKSWVWSFLVICLSVFLIAGCSGGSQQTDGKNSGGDSKASGESSATIKIGVIVADTGPASALGKPEADVARLLNKQLKDKDFNGKKVELIIEDYETDDTNAVVLLKKMISEHNVAAVVGGTQTSTSVALMGVAAENKIPLVALGVLNDDQFNEYTVQAPQSNKTVLQNVINYLKDNNIDSVAWINARDGFGQTGLPVFEGMAKENGIDIVAKEDFDAEATDMTVQLTKIKPKNPGAIIIWSRPPGAGIIAKNYSQLGIDVPMIQSHAVSNQGFLDQVGADGVGVLVLGSKLNVLDSLEDNEQTQLFKDFAEPFMAEYDYNPGPFGGYAYDGIQMVLQAITEGNTDSDSIKKYLETISYKGVTGTYNLSPDNRNGVEGDGMAILKVGENGWELE
ncbi:ABC transporter substrate-binding protein [Fredinandcohnia sp. QZ13]|uniref:ABC transporter substrate-binding protein n=1 Tax=Fredinandcohnia sp. QZ13 TaxID=3073144 RepID=UPI00285321B1|nr:ABC transporter substrate-binding protein [Fredinandcohnia sp. QZ13]MDR4887354.1 ABC transporter substrate-binding protein [Fredinandcohnia sp. QZ13]